MHFSASQVEACVLSQSDCLPTTGLVMGECLAFNLIVHCVFCVEDIKDFETAAEWVCGVVRSCLKSDPEGCVWIYTGV